jgi:hypothetical protein
MAALPLPPSARAVVTIGALALGLVVINQASALDVEPALQRAGVLAGLLAVLLMLVGVLWTRVQPDSPARVALVGTEGLELSPDLPDSLARELAWGSRMLLTATPAATLQLIWGETTLLRRGLLGEGVLTPGPICARCLSTGKAISLVDLRLYPGRAEFTGLLPDLPAVVIQPLALKGLLVLGGWSPRCFSRSDLAWIEGWAQRLSDDLQQAEAQVCGTPQTE